MIDTLYPSINEVVTNQSLTYNVSLSKSGLIFDGNEYENHVMPNLILYRENNYAFDFQNEKSVFDFYDTDGNLIAEHNSQNWSSQFKVVFGINSPSEMVYKLKNSDIHGRVHLRNPNQINGRVTLYKFTNNSDVFCGENQNIIFQTKSNQTGVYLGSLLSDQQHSFLNSPITANVYEDLNENILCKLKAPIGCLVLNTFTTLCEVVQSKMDLIDHKKSGNLVKKFFGLSEKYNLLTDDPLEFYIHGKMECDVYIRMILFSLLYEYVSKNSSADGYNQIDTLLNFFADNILSEKLKFSYYNIASMNIPSDVLLSDSFADCFNNLSVRLFALRTKGQKRDCVIKNIISTLQCSRDVIFEKLSFSESAENYSVNKQNYYNSTNVPEIQTKIILQSQKDCTISPSIGHRGYFNVDTNFLNKVFNQTLPMQIEIANQLIEKTLRLGTDEESYCYTIKEFLHFEDENINEIQSEIVNSFVSAIDCCEVEQNARVDRIIPSYTEPVPNESDLLQLQLIEGDGGETMLNYTITNENCPYEKIGENQFRFYVNRIVSHGSGEGTAPSYIAIPNSFSDSLKDKNITIAYNTEVPIFDITRIRYDFVKSNIVNSYMQNNGILEIETELLHGYKIGDTISIQESEKNGIIDGDFKVISAGDYTLTLEFTLPIYFDLNVVENVGGVIESFNSSKIYCNVSKFSAGDFLVFEESVIHGTRFEIIDISNDFLGSYLVVTSYVPNHASRFTKSHTQNIMENVIEFEHQTSSAYYEATQINSTEQQLWLTTYPDVIAGGRAGSVLSYIEFYYEKIENEQLSETAPLISNDFTYGIQANSIIDSPKQTNMRKLLQNSEDIDPDDFDIDDISSDWNMDGVVNEKELKILERFVLLKPSTLEEYNHELGLFPMSEVLPNVVTAQYACQELCCHDDFTSTEDFIIEDVYVYDAFQHYVDYLGSQPLGELEDLEAHYDILEVQGLLPELQVQVVYMPTDPREFQRCGDYTENGAIVSDDSNIYYANYLYTSANGGQEPPSVEVFNAFYNELVAQGVVPSLVEPIKKLPSLEADTTITSTEGDLNKNCDDISWKDLQIMNEWLRQGKPTSIDEFNANRLEGIPRACFLPIEDYDSIGTSNFKLTDMHSGTENL